MDWDKLRVFLAVAKAGSVSHAAENLHMSQSAVSRQITALEDSINMVLFHRHPRGVDLTGQGAILQDTVLDIQNRLDNSFTNLQSIQNDAVGPLRLQSSVSLGSGVLTPLLENFFKEYPHITLSLHLDDEWRGFNYNKIDVAIISKQVTEKWLIQIPLQKIPFGIYASKIYLEERGKPYKLEDLSDHILIGSGGSGFRYTGDWLIKYLDKHHMQYHSPLNIDNYYGIFRAIYSGIGIGCIPNFLGEIGRDLLVPLLPELPCPALTMYFTYPEELKHIKRIHALKNYLKNKLKKIEKP